MRILSYQTRMIRFDEQAIAAASLEDLEPARWERFATRRTQDKPENLLQKLGMARLDEDGALRPTVAGVLGKYLASRGTIANYLSLPLIFMGGWAGYAIRQGANLAIPLTFLTFSRSFESEADMLGLQYMYKCGYDPTAFVDFFDKIQSLEKKKPGTIAKVFGTHPMTDDRIKDAQKNIQDLLKAKPEYVVTTSEFNDVKGRLVAMNSRRKVEDKDPNKPTLRKAPGSGSTVPVEGSGKDTTTTGDNADDRPTLKRRD